MENKLMNILQWLIVYHSKINLSLRTCQQWKDLFEQLWGKRTRRVFTKIVHTSECLVMYFCLKLLLHSWIKPESIGRQICCSFARNCWWDSRGCNKCNKKVFIYFIRWPNLKKAVGYFHSALEILLCDYVHVFFLQICWIRQWTWGKAK